MVKSSPEYWNERYLRKETGWDIGTISTPLKEYIDQLENKYLKILVPGAGNGHEVEYLYQNGFFKTFLLDFSKEGISNFTKRYPGYPVNQILHEDFFEHHGNYDLIIEQTFFSSIDPKLREKYVEQCFNLLKPDGKMVGLLFSHTFSFEGPPYGGTIGEYRNLFNPFFDIEVLETAFNSIKPRKDRELFMLLRKKQF